MKIVKANQITLTDKDIIEVDTYDDFEIIHRDMFTTNTYAYDLNGMLYLLSQEVAYLHRRKNGLKNK